MLTVLLALAIGLGAGVLSGLFGIGGGIVMVPALVFLLRFPQKTATGTSLAALILPVALLGVIEYARQGHVDFKIGALLAVGIFFGAFVGAKLALGTSDVTLRRGFAVLLVLAAARLALVR